MDRRHFLKSGAAGVAALGALSETSFAEDPTANSSPNERVNVAQVGIGGKGINNRVMLLGTRLCNIVALCDVDLEGSRTLPARISNGDAPVPDGESPGKYGIIEKKAPYFSDFRVMLDKMHSQIDAVVISTPDHTHFPVAMAAMALGKHVWVEKPLAHTFNECELLMKMAERSGVVTQMGNQGHSSANRTQFDAWTKAGVISDVTKVVAYMNKGRRWHGWGEKVTEYPSEPLPKNLDWDIWTGPAQENAFSYRLHPANWRCWFEYGSGALGDWAPHIMDTCHRFLKLGLPTSVSVERKGENPLVYPQQSTLCFSFPEREGMPACDLFWYDGKKNVPEFESKLGQVEMQGPGKVIYGKDRVFQGGSHTSTLKVIHGDTDSLPEFETKVPNHWMNFIQACRGEATTNSPFHISAPMTQVLNLGMIAQQLGGTIEFDRESKTITNNAQANDMLTMKPRKGWEEYYRMS